MSGSHRAAHRGTEPDMSTTTTQIPTHVTSAAQAPTAERQPVWKHGPRSCGRRSRWPRCPSSRTSRSGFDASSAATLITLHTVAAAIVVPTLAGRLAHTR